MPILVDKRTRVVVQGITGKEGAFHAARCKEYGTTVVGGVTPGKGGTTHEGFPVWNTVAEAVAHEGPTARSSSCRRRRRRTPSWKRRRRACRS